MIKEFHLHREELAGKRMPMRFTLRDIIFFFGDELKEVGSDLEMEIQFSINYRPDLVDAIVVKVFQHDRFRVRPANSFYPYAII